MPILRKLTREKNFTVLPNKLLQNHDLTFEARGLLFELLSRPQDWTIYKTQLVTPKQGITVINRIFKELQEAGFLFIHSERCNGKISDRYWIASDELLTKEDFKKTVENLNDGKPYVKETLIQGNQQLQNKDITQKNDITQNKDFYEKQKIIENYPSQQRGEKQNYQKKPIFYEYQEFIDKTFKKWPCEIVMTDLYKKRMKGLMVHKNVGAEVFSKAAKNYCENKENKKRDMLTFEDFIKPTYPIDVSVSNILKWYSKSSKRISSVPWITGKKEQWEDG